MAEMENTPTRIECMQEIPDPRAPYNQRHKFLDIILIAVTAILCGMDTWKEIEDWACSRKEWLETFLELPGGIPSHDTINRVFQMVDPNRFHGAFFHWTKAVVGKTIRRSKDESRGNRPSHVVSAWACSTSLVLGQLRVDEKTNEMKTIPELLEDIALYFKEEFFQRPKKELEKEGRCVRSDHNRKG